MGLWCRRCRLPARATAVVLVPLPSEAVHAETGQRECAGGGDIRPTAEDPVLRDAADEIEREFPGCKLSVSAGFFRADPERVPPGHIAVHYEADTAGEMRRVLARAAGRAAAGASR
jgi:hypothetical protein